MPRRRQSGSIRRLPSGQYQARIRTGAGERITIGTFSTRRAANLALSAVDTEQARGSWTDPRRAEVPFGPYATAWLAERAGLAPRTREIYASLLKVHIGPTFEKRALKDISPSDVRRWYAELSSGSSPSMAPKAYRLLRSILATAVDDDVLAKNPCRIKKAGAERSEERNVVSVPELYTLAEGVPERYRAMVLLAGLAGLRTGELLGLTRADVDLLHASVNVRRQRVRLDSGEVRTGAPKTAAGNRKVAIPASLVPELDRHLATHTGTESDALVFTGAAGGPLDRTNFRQRVWLPATQSTGHTGLRFHDLRHTAATLAALTGATTKELMARLGHSTPRAALIYQHATEDRDRAIADVLDTFIQNASVTPIDRESASRWGTFGARNGHPSDRSEQDAGEK